MHQRTLFGLGGEGLAAHHYEQQGYRILARNWTCLAGELDLIVEKDGEVIFVEVKTRRSIQGGFPEESVHRRKLMHIRRCIEFWLIQAPFNPRRYRIEVCAITCFSDGRKEVLCFAVFD
jgi:putative endonuclease